MSYIDESQEMRRKERREKIEAAFFDYIEPFWKQTERIQHYNEWFQFLNAIYTAADLADEQFKDVKKQKSKKTIFQQISDSPTQRIPLNLNTLIISFDRLMMAYIGMKSQKMIEGPVSNDENDLLDPNSFYGLALGGTYKISIKDKEQHLKVILNRAKMFGVDDLADGYFGIALKRLLDGLDLCKNLTDVFLLRWVKGENDDWFKLPYGEGEGNWAEGYFVLDKDYKIEVGDRMAFVRVKKGSTMKETMKRHDENLIKKGILSTTKNEPKPEKITTESKVENSQPPKTNFKSNKMTELTNSKQLSHLFAEAVKTLKKDFSDFDTWIDELTDDLETVNIDLQDEMVLNEFLTQLLAYMNRMLRQGKVSLEKIDEINNTLFGDFGDEVLNHPYYKQLGETIKEINNGELITTGKRKRRVEPKPINTMNEVDKAKTGESVNEVKPKRSFEQREPKEKVIRVARTPKPKIDFAEALKKQLKSTIKEHPFNFEVYQNPTKSTITFNKKGDIATIRPTFKAKITFP